MEAVLNNIIDGMYNDIIHHTRELVKIKSTLEDSTDKLKPFGEGIDKCLKYSLNLADNLNLRTENIDGYAATIEMGDGEDIIGILTHIDVVPEGKGWTLEPYGAVIRNERIYGRGSLDDKGPLIASIFALKAIMESGLKISKRARIIIGTDEETFGRGIKYYLQKCEVPSCGFSPDAEFPVIYAEKGIMRFEISDNFEKDFTKSEDLILQKVVGGSRLNVVADHAEALFEVKNTGLKTIQDAVEKYYTQDCKFTIVEKKDNMISIIAHGKSAHASTPEVGANAISSLVKLLDTLEFGPLTIKKYINYLSDNFCQSTNGKEQNLNLCDAISGCLTINIGIIDVNSELGKTSFDLRYPVTSNGDEIWRKILTSIDYKGYQLKEIQHKPPLYVDPDSELIKSLKSVYEEIMNEEGKLISIGGGTYCRYVDNFVAFGPVFPGQRELAHEPDEYISISDLIKITKIYSQAIYKLMK